MLCKLLKMQKGQAVVFLLLAAAVVGFIGAIFYIGQLIPKHPSDDVVVITPQPIVSPTPTPIDETANWKIYSNDKLKLSLKYPPNWTLSEYANKDSEKIYRVFDLKPQDEEDKKIHSTINFRYYENPEELSIEDFEEKLGDNIEGVGNCGIYLPNDVMVKNSNGVNGYFREKGICEPLEAKFYTWVNKDKLFQLIDFRWFNSPEDKVISDIFKSVKFLDQRSEQKYTCPENGWENCMPILSPEAQIQCSKEAMQWKKENCPNFQGGAL